jgi:CHASE3 domain sensor protein
MNNKKAMSNKKVTLVEVRTVIAGSTNKADALKAIGALGKVVETETVTDENGNESEVEIVESAFDKAIASAARAIAKALKAMPEGITEAQVQAAAALASEATMLSIAAHSAAPSTATATDTAEAFATASELATV